MGSQLSSAAVSRVGAATRVALNSFESLVELMEDQHQQVATLIHQVDEALTVWRHSPTVTFRNALVEGLDPLITALTQHLDTEEHLIVPLMEQHITATEWNGMIRGNPPTSTCTRTSSLPTSAC
jgi:hemerythrin-like domain-containing protein